MPRLPAPRCPAQPGTLRVSCDCALYLLNAAAICAAAIGHFGRAQGRQLLLWRNTAATLPAGGQQAQPVALACAPAHIACAATIILADPLFYLLGQALLEDARWGAAA